MGSLCRLLGRRGVVVLAGIGCVATVICVAPTAAAGAAKAPAHQSKAAAPAKIKGVTITTANTRLDGSVVVSPGAERVPAKPGQTIHKQLIVQNRTTGTLQPTLEIGEVVGSNAQAVVSVRHGVHEGAAAWASIPTSSLTLKPGGTAFVTVTITVPKHVQPGSQAFAITVVQQPQQTQQTKGAGISARFANDAIFVVDLPGKAPVTGKITGVHLQSAGDAVDSSVQHREVTHALYVGPQTFTLTIDYHNTGARLLTPSGTVDVTNLFGHVVKTYKIPSFTVYPQGSAAQTVSLKDFPSVGPFRASVHLQSDAGNQHKTLHRIWLLPTWLKWVLIVIGGIIVLGVLWVLLNLVGRRLLDDAWPPWQRGDDVDLDDDDMWDDDEPSA